MSNILKDIYALCCAQLYRMWFEVTAQGIRINEVCPGPTQTPMLQAEFDLAPNPEDEEKTVLKSIPAGRLGTPENIARVVLFLASDDAQFVHGAAMVADGGRTVF